MQTREASFNICIFSCPQKKKEKVTGSLKAQMKIHSNKWWPRYLFTLV